MSDGHTTQAAQMTDDYGNEVNRCRYTGRLVWPDDGRVIGAMIPGVKARYVMHKDAEALHKASAVMFHESEANCNTCARLQRTQHPKYLSGFLEGICGKTGKPIKFHPDDPMHMSCYESRWT